MFSKKYITVIFLIVLWIPFIIGSLNLSKKYEKKEEESGENRALQKMPEVDISHLDVFPALYENHFNDHFMLRNVFIDKLHEVRAKWFNESPVPEKGIIGSNNWLYLTDEMDIYNRTTTFSPEELKKLSETLEKRRQFLEEQHCKMYIYIIPPKIMVYPEYSNKVTKRPHDLTLGGQLEAYLKSSKIPVCYLLPTLLEDKKKEGKEHHQLFKRTDNHWTDYGSYLCYQKIINDLSKDFPGLKSLREDELIEKDTLEDGGNIAVMLGMQKYFTEEMRKFKVKNPQGHKADNVGYEPTPGFPYPWDYEKQFNNTNEQLPRALFIRDSFTENMIPYFSESFSHSTFIFDAWKYQLHEDIVKNEKPQAMVYVIFEKFLKDIDK